MHFLSTTFVRLFVSNNLPTLANRFMRAWCSFVSSFASIFFFSVFHTGVHTPSLSGPSFLFTMRGRHRLLLFFLLFLLPLSSSRDMSQGGYCISVGV